MKRRGFTLIDVVVALGILAVPVIVVMTLIQNNMTGAKFNQDRLGAQLVLNDLAGLLSGMEVEKLKELPGKGPAGIDEMLESRVNSVPQQYRDKYRTQIKHLFGQISFAFAQDTGSIRGMARLELTAKLPNKATANLAWFLRPQARVDSRPPKPGEARP